MGCRRGFPVRVRPTLTQKDRPRPFCGQNHTEPLSDVTARCQRTNGLLITLSNVPLSIRDIATTMPPIRTGSSFPAISAACSPSSNTDCDTRSAIEAVIGHLKFDGHLGRCNLEGAAGRCRSRHPQRHRLQLQTHPRWLRSLLHEIQKDLLDDFPIQAALNLASLRATCQRWWNWRSSRMPHMGRRLPATLLFRPHCDRDRDSRRDLLNRPFIFTDRYNGEAIRLGMFPARAKALRIPGSENTMSWQLRSFRIMPLPPLSRWAPRRREPSRNSTLRSC